MSYKVSPSSMSEFYKDGICRKNWFHKFVRKSIERDPPTNQMVKGQLFEILAIGSGVSGSELPDHSFLYNTKGKSIELTRIEAQAERFKRMVDRNSEDYIGLRVDSVQVRLENERMKGVIDMKLIDEFDQINISDLKFTADVDSDFGDFSWGRNPDTIDWSQIAIYKRLWMDNFQSDKDPKTSLFAFDSSPRVGAKYFDIRLSDSYVDNVCRKADVVYDFVEKINESESDLDVAVNPTERNCDGCPLNCFFRFKAASLKKIKVYV